MSNNKSIHEFDFNLICEYFSSIERQGPGSPEATIQALGFIENLTDNSRIADIGCGTGGQTMVLAQHTRGSITGVDLFPAFIDIFNANVASHDLQDRLKGVVGSMDDLNFSLEELDLIWSEGAIYNIGYDRGLKEWKKFLKDGGYIAVTEVSWLTDERPEEVEKYWLDAYAEIDTIPNKVNQLQKAGYMPVAHFVLPDSCWTDNFYIPQVEAQKIFLSKYPGNETVTDLVHNQKHEALMYSKYKDYYGYVFYIGKKQRA